KHVVLGLLFLKFISDAFVRQHEVLSNKPGQNPNDPKAYHDAGGFWVPPAARWPKVVARAHEPGAGATIDAAMAAIEAVNPPLRGVLPRRYSDPARPPLESRRLGELIQLVDGVERDPDRSRDLLGRVYEYFLTNFAAAEGRNGGQFYTPRCVVRLLIEMLAPVRGVIYDPACGSGGMFVQSDRFIREHGGDPDDLKIYGQESNPTTWRLAKMNLAIRGLACDLGRAHADSFHEDLHAGLRADYVIANPPFNLKDWGGDLLADDPRWRYGQPPIGNANFAWVQHFIHHLAPRGLAGFVLANGAMSTTTSGEGVIRQRIVEDDLVDCMVALPGQLFYSTQIPVSLWILARDKRDRRFRARAGEVLFIDARGLGKMVDRTHRTLTSEELERIAGTYHAFRGDPRARPYADVAGFCKVATIAEIARQDHVLTPGRYVGSSTTIPDAADFDERLEELRARLERHFAEAALLERKIQRFLQALKSRGA
ncbi:MAG: type I restriction-modification system subunit M, partial [Myxococcales bacterium]|nr:type I restriction-modification system subunit M [Myxococcales bacterium]